MGLPIKAKENFVATHTKPRVSSGLWSQCFATSVPAATRGHLLVAIMGLGRKGQKPWLAADNVYVSPPEKRKVDPNRPSNCSFCLPQGLPTVLPVGLTTRGRPLRVSSMKWDLSPPPTSGHVVSEVVGPWTGGSCRGS